MRIIQNLRTVAMGDRAIFVSLTIATFSPMPDPKASKTSLLFSGYFPGVGWCRWAIKGLMGNGSVMLSE
jgi:hypothetical protein